MAALMIIMVLCFPYIVLTHMFCDPLSYPVQWAGWPPRIAAFVGVVIVVCAKAPSRWQG